MRALYYLLRCSLNESFVYAVLGGGYKLRAPSLLTQESSSSSQLSQSVDQFAKASGRGLTNAFILLLFLYFSILYCMYALF